MTAASRRKSLAERSRSAREQAAPEEAYRAQHGALINRAVVDADGRVRTVRGAEPFPALARLARLKTEAGAPFFDARELSAAAALRAAFERGQIGLVAGIDWRAPPRGSGPRGPGAVEARAAQGAEARVVVERALCGLATPLAQLVRAVCLEDQGLEQVERRRGWPARSGKVALKLALAQLARGSS